jgi:uncharacterized protein with PIN domain
MEMDYKSCLRTMTELIPVTLHFHGWLKVLAGRTRRGEELPTPFFTRRTSTKNLIESFGVPHTEIGGIRADCGNVTFDHVIEHRTRLDISPLCPPVNVLAPSTLRPEPLPAIRFLVDMNVAKLAAKLRMAGFDTLYNPQWGDHDLAEIAEKQQCIILTRDIMLLKRNKVTYGHLVREVNPKKQLAETIAYYGLFDSIRSLTRCMRCNGLLAPVAKEEIQDKLEPLTRKYYQTFHRCSSCFQVYWPGSHHDAMVEELGRLNNYTSLPF